jgi:hypothetical protein
VEDTTAVFNALRTILARYALQLSVKKDTSTEYYLDTHHVQKNGAPLFFGAVKANKSSISFHIMPVYVRPALLGSISPGLRKRMQGKSCFNFAAVEPALFQELAALTMAGYESYREQGFVPPLDPAG